MLLPLSATNGQSNLTHYLTLLLRETRGSVDPDCRTEIDDILLPAFTELFSKIDKLEARVAALESVIGAPPPLTRNAPPAASAATEPQPPEPIVRHVASTLRKRYVRSVDVEQPAAPKRALTERQRKAWEDIGTVKEHADEFLLSKYYPCDMKNKRVYLIPFNRVKDLRASEEFKEILRASSMNPWNMQDIRGKEFHEKNYTQSYRVMLSALDATSGKAGEE